MRLGALTGAQMANDRGLRLLECMRGQGLERLDYINPGKPTNLFRANLPVHCGPVLRLGAEVVLELPVCEVLDMVDISADPKPCTIRLSLAATSSQ